MTITVTDLFAGAGGKLTVGSLCSGYGGLDLAVEQFFGAQTVWFSEFEEAPSRVLEAHWPGVPNHGDMTAIDWASVEPVDIITGGTPCQDLSAAGRRQGMTEGTRSNLWVQMREAIAVIRPRVVVWENVRGAYSARADSDVESETGLLGCPDGRPALRALGRVLGDLSELGFDAEWVGVRASDAGAPHARFRVFVVAYAQSLRFGHAGTPGIRGLPAAAVAGGLPTAPDAENIGHERGRLARNGRTRPADGRLAAPHASSARLGEHPGAASAEEAGARGRDLVAGDRGSRPAAEWGPYRPAIERWERVLGRVAPAPTNPDGKGGAHRLAPEFVEWMMGAAEGWVTDPSLRVSRAAMLKMLGNGVVTQQAHLAISIAWERLSDVREAVAA